MEKSAIQHSKYMGAVKQLTHKELKNKRNFSGENEEKRMMKATHGFYFLSKHKTKINESVAFIEVDAKNLDAKKLALDIQNQLEKDKATDATITKIGYGVIINRTKNSLQVYVTRITGHKTNETKTKQLQKQNNYLLMLSSAFKNISNSSVVV